MELFVYVIMLVDDESRKAPIVFTLGADDEEHERVRSNWRVFDASECECFKPEDKVRLLAVVQGFPGGVQGFNDRVKILAAHLFSNSRQWTHASILRRGATRFKSLSKGMGDRLMLQHSLTQIRKSYRSSASATFASSACATLDVMQDPHGTAPQGALLQTPPNNTLLEVEVYAPLALSSRSNNSDASAAALLEESSFSEQHRQRILTRRIPETVSRSNENTICSDGVDAADDATGAARNAPADPAVDIVGTTWPLTAFSASSASVPSTCKDAQSQNKDGCSRSKETLNRRIRSKDTASHRGEQRSHRRKGTRSHKNKGVPADVDAVPHLGEQHTPSIPTIIEPAPDDTPTPVFAEIATRLDAAVSKRSARSTVARRGATMTDGAMSRKARTKVDGAQGLAPSVPTVRNSGRELAEKGDESAGP